LINQTEASDRDRERKREKREKREKKKRHVLVGSNDIQTASGHGERACV